MQPQKARFKGLEDIVDIHLNKKDGGDEVKFEFSILKISQN